MGIQLDNIEVKFRKTKNTTRPHGLDFSGLKAGTDIPSGEFKGIHGHTFKDTAAGWVGSGGVAPTALLTAAAVSVAGLVSGTHYGIRASANAVELDLDAAPTAGAILYFTIVDNSKAVTIDVDGGLATDRSFWGRDLVSPIGTMKGKSFVLRAVSDGTNVMWGTDFEDEQVELPGPTIAASAPISTLTDGVTYPIDATGAAIDITLDSGGAAGKHVSFTIINSANLIRIVVGAFSYWGVNFPFPAGESAGKSFTLFSDGAKWAMDLSPDMVIPGDIRAKLDNAEVSAGDGNDIHMKHDGANSDLTNDTGILTIGQSVSTAETAGRAVNLKSGRGGAAAAAAVGGAGGQLDVYAENGGAASATFAAGAGGLARVIGGTGGAATAAQAAGAGGNAMVMAGAAGSNALGGGAANGGDLELRGGGGSAGGVNGAVNIGALNTSQVICTPNLDAVAGVDVSGANLTLAAGLAVHGLGSLDMTQAVPAVTLAGYALGLTASTAGAASVAAAGGLGGSFTIRAGAGGAGHDNPQNAGAGGELRLVPGAGGVSGNHAGSSAGAGGQLSLWAASAGAVVGVGTGGAGGDVNMRPGLGTGSAAPGTVRVQSAAGVNLLTISNAGIATFVGNLDATAGLDVSGANLSVAAALDIRALGQLDLNADVAANDAAGFEMDITAGKGGTAVAAPGGAGGTLAAVAGLGGDGAATQVAGAGGVLNLTGGAAGSGGGGGGNAGGQVNLTGGAGSVAGDGGDVVINGGLGPGAGTDGKIHLGAANTEKVQVAVNLDAELGLDVSGADLTIQTGRNIQGQGPLVLNTAAVATPIAGHLVSATAGNGGAASAAVAAGAGGAVSLASGNGGAGHANPQNAGNAGVINLTAGNGGASGGAASVAGAGADVTLTAGGAGAGAGALGNDGGVVALVAGAATGNGTHGNVRVKLPETAGATAFQIRDSADVVVCAIDSDGRKQNQILMCNALSPLSLTGAAPDFVRQTDGSLQLPASLANKTMLIAITGVKKGDVLKGCRILGTQVSGGGNCTIEGTAGITSFFRVTKGAAAPVVTEVGFRIADLTVIANTALDLALDSWTDETVGDDMQYFLRVEGTTAAACTIAVIGCEVDIHRM